MTACDDEPIAVGPLPVGTYVLGVVAWDQALWEGETEPLELGGTAQSVDLLVPLDEVPIPD